MNLSKMYESSLEPVVLSEKNEEKLAQRKAGTVPSSKSGHLFRSRNKNGWVLSSFVRFGSFPTLAMKPSHKSFGAVHLPTLESSWQKWLLKTIDQTAKRKILQSLKIGMEKNCHCLPKLLAQDTWFLGFLHQCLSKEDDIPRIGNHDFEDSQTYSSYITVWAEWLHLYDHLSYLFQIWV